MLVARWGSATCRCGSQDHALVGRRRACLVVLPRRRVPRRGRGTAPPADRRAGLDQRDPRHAEPVLDRRGTRRRRPARAPRHLRSRATTVDERNCQRSLENALNHFAVTAALGVAPENPAEQNMALLPHVERPARGRRPPLQRASCHARPVDGVLRAQRRVRLHPRICRRCPRRQPRAGAGRRHPVYEPSTRPGALSARSSAVRSERRSRSPGPRPRERARGLSR